MKPESPSQKQEGEEPKVYESGSIWNNDRPKFVAKEDYDRLREQLDAAVEWKERMQRLATPAEFTLNENARLRKELEAVRKRTIEAEKDAERYRWLRGAVIPKQVDVRRMPIPSSARTPGETMALDREGAPEVAFSVVDMPVYEWRWRCDGHGNLDAAIDQARSLPLTGSGE